MTKFCFCWSISGNTVIEAATLAEAQGVFDKMTTADMEENGSTDFAQDQVLIETEPGVFDERPK